mmetsp:Transcript_90325/g.215685  ORF Transcript_90325/g.215685 Transcript_90325/m.215685 type:complete len:323 (-) Transcript_90325:1659-2627(-)
MICDDWKNLVGGQAVGRHGCCQHHPCICNLHDLLPHDPAVHPSNDHGRARLNASPVQVFCSQRGPRQVEDAFQMANLVPVRGLQLPQEQHGGLAALVQLQAVVTQRLHEVVDAHRGPNQLGAANRDAADFCVAHQKDQHVSSAIDQRFWQFPLSHGIPTAAFQQGFQLLELLLFLLILVDSFPGYLLHPALVILILGSRILLSDLRQGAPGKSALKGGRVRGTTHQIRRQPLLQKLLLEHQHNVLILHVNVFFHLSCLFQRTLLISDLRVGAGVAGLRGICKLPQRIILGPLLPGHCLLHGLLKDGQLLGHLRTRDLGLLPR